MLILVLSTLGLAYGQQAETVEFARNFYFDKHPVGDKKEHVQFDQVRNYNSIWVFEKNEPPCFILVKEEDRPYLAGYSFDNLFHKNGQVPEPAQLALEQIEASRLGDMQYKNRMKSFPQAVEPLLSTLWDQNSVANYFCPEDRDGPGQRVYTGCVAVAMGQIIKYYNKWNTFFFEAYHDAGKYGILQEYVGGYNWDKMEDQPICESLEVSRLLYHIGLVTKMGFGPTSSSTSNYNAYGAFKSFGYLSGGRMQAAFTDTAKWINEFYRNVSEFKPLLVTGWGHAYVCDGYDEQGLFHFNLGWGGWSNGYYPLIGYGSFPSTEAFTDLIPWSRHYPPVGLHYQSEGQGGKLVWNTHRDKVVPAEKFRIYSNEARIAETTDSSFSLADLPPGTHRLQVSAFYPGGESSWIGPITIHVDGREVTIADQALRKSINQALKKPEQEWLGYAPREDEFEQIEILEITDPVSSLAGIERCKDLKILRINDNQGLALDLAPLSQIQELRILELGNMEAINLDALQENNWLIKVHLDQIEVGSLKQFTRLPDLISLKVASTKVTDIDSLQQLTLLKHLQLKNIGLTELFSLASLRHVQQLDFSDNQIERINLDHSMPELRVLDLEHNQLQQLQFLDQLNRLEKLNLNHNQINDLLITKEMPYLEELSITNNDLDSVGITRNLPLLKRADFSHNAIPNINRLIYHAPNLVNLNLEANALTELWEAGLQQLQVLNLGNNEISLIGPINKNPELKELNLSGNLIGDFHPLIINNFYKQLDQLNLGGNPSSKESHEAFLPLFMQDIEHLVFPLGFEPKMPCYPLPLRQSFLKDDEATLTWINGDEQVPLNYDIWFGKAGEMALLAEGINQTEWPVTLQPNETYTWQVVSHYSDISFTSGLYEFQTYRPVELPYRESFEEYTPYGYLAVESPYWRTFTNDPGGEDDAQVVDFKSLDGNQSLRMISNSHLGLMVNQFDGHRLLVSFGMYIEDNSRAAIKVTNLNGADLAVYLKSNGKGDVFYNDKLVSQFFYQSRQWVKWQIFISGSNKAMDIRMNGNLIVDERLAFADKRISFKNIEFSTEAGVGWPFDGFPLFYIDDIYISGYGASTYNEKIDYPLPDVALYPNPVNNQLNIKNKGLELIQEIAIYAMDGRQLYQRRMGSGDQEMIVIDVHDLAPGQYLLRLKISGQYQSRRISIQ